MGFFDRLLKKDSQDSDNTIKPRKPAKEKPAEFFLDADSSSSLGDVNYMRESKTIRRTFPGDRQRPGLVLWSAVRSLAGGSREPDLSQRSQPLGTAGHVRTTARSVQSRSMDGRQRESTCFAEGIDQQQ